MYHILKVNHEQFEKTPKNDCIYRSLLSLTEFKYSWGKVSHSFG